MSKPQDDQHTPQDAEDEEREGDELDLDPEVVRDLETSEEDAEAVKGGRNNPLSFPCNDTTVTFC